MLYVFHGTEIDRSREKAHRLIDSLRAKKPDAALERVSADDWNASLIESHLGGQGLFSNKYIVFLDRLTENSEAKEQVIGFLGPMNESPNIFVALEGKLNAESRRAFEKYAERTVLSDKEAANRYGGSGGSRADFNIFALADAVGARDTIKAWTIYRQAVDNDIEPESILGTLFWQLKSMVLAGQAKSAAEAGLSPFVYGKSKRYSGKYSEEELAELTRGLIELYHDGHRGSKDIGSGTEALLLTLGRVQTAEGEL